MPAQKIEFTVVPQEDAPENFGTFFEVAADAFYACVGVFDQDMSGDGETGHITFTMGVDEVDPLEAFRAALGAVRTAMHAAGASTLGWEQHLQVTMNASEAPASPTPDLVAA